VKKFLIITGIIIMLIAILPVLVEGQLASIPRINPPAVDIKAIILSKIPLIDIEYQSDSMIVLRGYEETLLATNGTMMPFWNAIDIVKHYGYSLDEVATSGMGSQGNPTRFYAVMSKP
jgi:hypothetical protein